MPLLALITYSRDSGKQKSLIEDEQSQYILKLIADDTTSLLVLCDSDSFITKRTETTTNTSKLSMKFAFDAELLQHKAYQSTIRSLMIRAVARRDPPTLQAQEGWIDQLENNLERERRNHSIAIDRQLGKQRRELRQRTRVLMMGSQSTKSMLAIRASLADEHSVIEQLWYRTRIYHHVLLETLAHGEQMRLADVAASLTLLKALNAVRAALSAWETTSRVINKSGLPRDLASAIKDIAPHIETIDPDGLLAW